MSKSPAKVFLYHITHVDNLPKIIAAGGLRSDAQMRSRQADHLVIGFDHIKDRRLSLPVACHAGTMVGDYVPFYFCPRSAMLYVIHMRNEELAFTGGQDSIVHLITGFSGVTQWADKEGARWAFSTSNAGGFTADFYSTPDKLDQIDWQAVNTTYWAECREQKQAEFLVYESFPFGLVLGIGVKDDTMKERVETIVAGVADPPTVKTMPSWYY